MTGEDLALLIQLNQDLAAFDAMRRTNPLLVWRAWDNPTPKTSQRRAMQLLAFTKELQIWGGNRSGKTELARALLIALVLGSDHPDAREFWQYHDMDPDVFPRGPGQGWIIAITSNDSKRYHRQQILDLVPKWGPVHPMSDEGLNWHAWNLWGRGEANLDIMVPNYEEPAKIHFKSEDQDLNSFQGDAIRVALHDEEGKSGHRYDSTAFRLIDHDGYQIMSNTPIYGKTWAYDRFVKNPQPGARLTRIYAEHNPYLPRHRVAKYANDAVRGRGEYVDSADLIWWMFRDDIHIVPRFDLPEGTPRFKAIDFGTRNPFAIVWAGLLQQTVVLPNGRRLYDGTIVCYREHYLPNQTLPFHVARMREMEGWIRDPKVERVEDARPHEAWIPGETPEAIVGAWADPEDPQLLMQLRQIYGVQVARARRAHKAGRDLVAALLSPDAEGQPRLVFMDHLLHTIKEVSGYSYKKTVDEKGAQKEEPQDTDNHTCDCVRYIAMGLQNELSMD